MQERVCGGQRDCGWLRERRDSSVAVPHGGQDEHVQGRGVLIVFFVGCLLEEWGELLSLGIVKKNSFR